MMFQCLNLVKRALTLVCAIAFCASANAEVVINAKTIQQLATATEQLKTLESKYPQVLEDNETPAFEDGGLALIKKIEASPAAADVEAIAKSNGFESTNELVSFSTRVAVAYMAGSADLSQLESMLVMQKESLPTVKDYEQESGGKTELVKNTEKTKTYLQNMITAIKNTDPKDIAEAKKYSNLLDPMYNQEEPATPR